MPKPKPKRRITKLSIDELSAVAKPTVKSARFIVAKSARVLEMEAELTRLLGSPAAVEQAAQLAKSIHLGLHDLSRRLDSIGSRIRRGR